MKRKPRDYGKLFEPKKFEPEHITIKELYGLGLAEMMLRANGPKKVEKLNEQKQIDKTGTEIRVREITETNKT